MPLHPPILFIGDVDQSDFAVAIADLQTFPNVRFASSISTAIELVASSDIEPALIILARSRPGDCRASRIASLRRAAPLARIVELLGPWCDGELRTGEPMAGTIRIACHQWPAWFARELLAVDEHALPIWTLPITASDEERMLARPFAPAKESGLIAIRGSHGDASDWLAKACQGAGYSTVVFERASDSPFGTAVAGVWSAGFRNDAIWQDLAKFVSAIAPAPVVCLLGFPRPEEHQLAASLGACCVLAQPLLAEDLLSSLRTAAIGRTFKQMVGASSGPVQAIPLHT